MNEPMTPRARWLAALRMQPVDCLPFWPKIFDVTYTRAQVAPFRDMTIPQLWAWLGCDPHVPLPACTREVRTRTSVERVENNGVRKTTYITPIGLLEAVDHWDLNSGSWHPVEFPVKRREDIAIMAEVYADCRVELDEEKLAQNREAIARIGENGSTWAVIGRSPLMNWLEFIAGIEGGHYLLADYPDEVETLFDAMHRVLMRSAEIMADKSPVDALYMIEDTSTTYVSPRQYDRYCKPQISAYGEIVRAAGRPLILHMCGHLKGLLPTLATMPADGFEAFTTPPVGNTTLFDGRTACPDKVLIGGTNAALCLEPADRIIAELAADLDALPHHRGIVISSAGMMPPGCPPERIKQVCDWVHAYRPRV
ncbi:MAG: uroporphyrinogen decarboxylase family protein [Anaerolineae bacterium]